MARMMPAFCPDSAPPGERAVYSALATSAGAQGWIVLHSLAVAEHVRQVEGEADFVIIVPGKGIVVVEVKSHRTVEVLDDGRWKLGHDEPKVRGPFQQAKEAMFSVRGFLEHRGVDLRSIPFLSAVWFTHLRARAMLPRGPEWHAWQVLDSESLKSGAAAAIDHTLAAGAAHLEGKLKFLRPGHGGPTPADAERIANLLRPRFELHVAKGEARQVRASQLTTFIGEQYTALDSMAENRAVLFTGPAGSGKTLLAVEAAQREVAQGRKGRLLCFNRLLGRRLAADLGGQERLSVGTFHQEMVRIAGVRPPSDAGQHFWNADLPNLTIETLLARGDEAADDFLIVDEIQDLAREPFLDVLDLLVKGGLKMGRVLMFGDFVRQAIFEQNGGRDLIQDRCGQLAVHGLTSNCRNLPRIGFVVNAFSRMEPAYVNFRRMDDGVDPTFVPYRDRADQSRLLVDAVSGLRAEGFELNEITVLSPLAAGSTAETTTDSWLRQVLQPADESRTRSGRLQHSTIHAFKGLESPAVVVTDLDRAITPNFEALLYVGLTRATDRLVAMIETDSLRAAFGGSL